METNQKSDGLEPNNLVENSASENEEIGFSNSDLQTQKQQAEIDKLRAERQKIELESRQIKRDTTIIVVILKIVASGITIALLVSVFYNYIKPQADKENIKLSLENAKKEKELALKSDSLAFATKVVQDKEREVSDLLHQLSIISLFLDSVTKKQRIDSISLEQAKSDLLNTRKYLTTKLPGVFSTQNVSKNISSLNEDFNTKKSCFFSFHQKIPDGFPQRFPGGTIEFYQGAYLSATNLKTSEKFTATKSSGIVPVKATLHLVPGKYLIRSIAIISDPNYEADTSFSINVTTDEIQEFRVVFDIKSREGK